MSTPGVNSSVTPGLSLRSTITKSGRVVFNAKRDKQNIHRRQRGSGSSGTNSAVPQYSKSNNDGDEVYNVLNHEIAITVAASATSAFSYAPLDGSISVITSVNNVTHSMIGQQHKQIADAIGINYLPGASDDWKVSYAGIAATRALHDSKNSARDEEMCVVQCGGLCTIFNGGDYIIRANDWVMWDMPKSPTAGGKRQWAQPEGTPASKLTFVPVPFRQVRMELQKMKYGLHTYSNPAKNKRFIGSADDEKAETYAIQKGKQGAVLLLVYNHVDEHVKSRVFARSLSTAKPGQAFDCILGAYCG